MLDHCGTRFVLGDDAVVNRLSYNQFRVRTPVPREEFASCTLVKMVNGFGEVEGVGISRTPANKLGLQIGEFTRELPFIG